MEPDIMPLHTSSPPPLDDDGDGEAGSEEDDFGDFGGFEASCSPPDSDSPFSLRRPCATTKPATHQPKCSFNHPVEQSQPTSTVDSGSCRGQIYVEGPDCGAESCLHFTNGYSERDPNSGTDIVPAVGACSPKEETGFADFTVFTEQTEHPWCCGFSPASSRELWDGREEGTNSSDGLREGICHPGQGVVMDSEPRLHHACEVKGNVCTKVNHCEKRDAALVQTSQDCHQPQEAAAALDFTPEEPRSVRKEVGEYGDIWRQRRRSFNYLQTKDEQEDGDSDEDQERRISAVPQTFSVFESASEDPASCSDDLSFECPSADLEPNVSSLISQEDQTDWDQTDDEEENELGNCDKGFHFCDLSATQETSATSNQPGTHFKDCSLEHQGNQGCIPTADAVVQSLGNLPPSDSFADFCSAPTQEGGDESWVEFKEGKTWTQFREPVSSLQSDGEAEEEQDRAGSYGVSRRSSCKVSLSCRVQQLLLTAFPDVEISAVGGEEEVLSLGALLHLPESEEEEEEEEIPEHCPISQWVRRRRWWPHQDLHDAVGLQFQWGGSHTNRTLLRCLDVEMRNIVFIGSKKQPVVVPAFASSLGMLEPTKDSVPAVGSQGQVVVTVQAPPGQRDTPGPSTGSIQEALPSSQLDWSSRGLSSSQDGTSPRRAPLFWGWK